MNKRPDEILVKLSRGGDQKAYAQLVSRNLKRVFAICLAMLGEMNDAEDAVQEVFVKGFERIGSLRDTGKFPGWIDQIARNRSRDMLRARSRHPEATFSSVHENIAADPGDEFADLKAALARLPEEHRTPLLIYYYDGKDTRTLAHELGLTQGGACARLHRARHQLRLLLEEASGKGGDHHE